MALTISIIHDIPMQYKYKKTIENKISADLYLSRKYSPLAQARGLTSRRPRGFHTDFGFGVFDPVELSLFFHVKDDESKTKKSCFKNTSVNNE